MCVVDIVYLYKYMSLPAAGRFPLTQVLFRALWQDRWAHALFDGLYPAYVSLARQDTRGPRDRAMGSPRTWVD